MVLPASSPTPAPQIEPAGRAPDRRSVQSHRRVSEVGIGCHPAGPHRKHQQADRGADEEGVMRTTAGGRESRADRLARAYPTPVAANPPARMRLPVRVENASEAAGLVAMLRARITHGANRATPR